MNLVINDYELNYRMAEGDSTIACGVDCTRYADHPCCENWGKDVIAIGVKRLPDVTTPESCEKAGGQWDRIGEACYKEVPYWPMHPPTIQPPTNDVSTPTTMGSSVEKLFTVRNFLLAGVTYLVFKMIFKSKRK